MKQFIGYTLLFLASAIAAFSFDLGTQTLSKTVSGADTAGATAGTIVDTTTNLNIRDDLRYGRFWIAVDIDLDSNFATDSLAIAVQHSLDSITWRSLTSTQIAPGALTVDSMFLLGTSIRPDSQFVLPWIRLIWTMHDSLGFDTGDTAGVVGNVYNWKITGHVIPYQLGGGQ